MQGVVKAYDPSSRLGSLLRDEDQTEIDLAENALDGSIFRFLRQGQRVNFDLDSDGHATRLRFGSELDMRTRTDAPPSPIRPGDFPE
jgi:CspA family cold shock protein